MKTQNQLIIQALSQAIKYEYSYMEAISNCLDNPDYLTTYNRCKSNIEEYRKLKNKLLKKEQK
jgi:hypothetical protein